jgi:hypothetical protein
MVYRKYHRRDTSPDNYAADSSNFKRFFFWPFKKKDKSSVRSGALKAEEVKRKINEIGVGKQIEILRVGYDGGIDDMPVLVEILDIYSYGFTGRIINLERQMIESATKNLVYAKKGGGVLEFSFNDGDIKEISVSRDEELLQQERNIENLKEILTALDTGDHIIVAYFDEIRKGTINTEGLLTEKNESNEIFSLQIEKINRIELEKKITKKFDINQDLVIDIEIV